MDTIFTEMELLTTQVNDGGVFCCDSSTCVLIVNGFEMDQNKRFVY